jgi:hypothetical protein
VMGPSCEAEEGGASLMADGGGASRADDVEGGGGRDGEGTGELMLRGGGLSLARDSRGDDTTAILHAADTLSGAGGTGITVGGERESIIREYTPPQLVDPGAVAGATAEVSTARITRRAGLAPVADAGGPGALTQPGAPRIRSPASNMDFLLGHAGGGDGAASRTSTSTVSTQVTAASRMDSAGGGGGGEGGRRALASRELSMASREASTGLSVGFAPVLHSGEHGFAESDSGLVAAAAWLGVSSSHTGDGRPQGAPAHPAAPAVSPVRSHSGGTGRLSAAVGPAGVGGSRGGVRGAGTALPRAAQKPAVNGAADGRRDSALYDDIPEVY